MVLRLVYFCFVFPPRFPCSLSHCNPTLLFPPVYLPLCLSCLCVSVLLPLCLCITSSLLFLLRLCFSLARLPSNLHVRTTKPYPTNTTNTKRRALHKASRGQASPRDDKAHARGGLVAVPARHRADAPHLHARELRVRGGGGDVGREAALLPT